MRPWYWPEDGQPHRANPFDWIMKDNIGASWWPDPYMFDLFREKGIKVIINCSEFDNRSDIPKDFKYYFFHIPDYGVPSEEQIQKFLKITDRHRKKKEPMVVHCVAGCGRTGQMIVAYAAYHDLIPKDEDPVKWVRERRNCFLETEEQKNFARKIAKKYQK